MEISLTEFFNSIKRILAFETKLEVFNRTVHADIFLVLFCVLCLVFIYMLISYLRFNVELFLQSHTMVLNKSIPVSIVFEVDEETPLNQLKEALDKIVHQRYNIFEVLVVVDSRNEVHKQYFLEMQQKFKHLHYTQFDSSRSVFINRDKIVRSLAVKSAKYQWVLLTNSRAIVTSKYWVQNMVSVIRPETKLVIGAFSLYGTHYTKLQQLIALYTVTRSMCLSFVKKPVVNLYSNLLVQKDFYMEKVLSNATKLADQDFLLNTLAEPKNIRVVLSKEVLVRKVRDKYQTWQQYFNAMATMPKQVSKGVKINLYATNLSALLFLLLTTLFLILPTYRNYTLYLLGFYLLLYGLYYLRAQKLFYTSVSFSNTLVLLVLQFFGALYFVPRGLFASKPKSRTTITPYLSK